MAHLVSSGGAFDAKRYGRVRLWGSLGFLVTVFAAGAWFEHFGMGHFPAWTVLSLLAVVASVWWLPDLKEALPRTRKSAGAAHSEKAFGAVVLCLGVFPCAVAHGRSTSSSRCYLDALGYSKTMIGLLWGGLGHGGDRLVLHAKPLAAALQPHGLAAAVRRADGAAHGRDRCPVPLSGPCCCWRSACMASPLPRTIRCASRCCRTISPAACAAAARPCTPCWAMGCPGCWAAWPVAC